MADLPPGLIRICGKYRLKKKIGSGSFGDVFHATNIVTGEDIAVKLEPTETDNPKLREEWIVYKSLGHSVGIPQIFWFGLERGYRAMVMSLLGPSLADIFESCGRKFSTKTVLMLAIQLINRIEYIHDHNYLHRDIKPDNLVMGRRDHPSESLVHVVDFGLAMQYRDPTSSAHIPYDRRPSITGTIRYLSINGHKGIELTRRDDLESLAYVLIYFLRGSLPWQGIEATSRKKKSTLIMHQKLSFSTKQLCKGLPDVFRTFLDYSRELPFYAAPDYTYLRTAFQDAFNQAGYIEDDLFDWSPTHLRMPGSFIPGSSSSDTARTRGSSDLNI